MNEIVAKLIKKEESREQDTINLIPSENFTSKAVREATGSVFMHKYSEGNVGARYYEGNEVVDELEAECIRMVKKVMLAEDTSLQDAWEANVQVLSGSTANLAVYNAILNPGDTILSMYLPDGGHLSHGWSYTPTAVGSSKLEVLSSKKDAQSSAGKESKVKDQRSKDVDSVAAESSISAQSSQHLAQDIYLGGSVKSNFNSKVFNIIQYRVDAETELINYDKLIEHLRTYKPKLFITGGTAYPRFTDYKKIRETLETYEKETGDKVIFLADVAHEAGLIAAGVHPSPFAYADFVTFTTHKTLRGPRGAVVMCKKEYIEAVNKSVMPGLLGGPFNHTIAGLLQSLYEADTQEFKHYSQQVIANAKLLAELFIQSGFRVVSGGTDKHMVLVDFSDQNISGRAVARILATIGIIANKNTVPFEKGTPVSPSGVRFGTPFITTRGFKEKEVREIFEIIQSALRIGKSIKNETFKEFNAKISEMFVIENSELALLKGRVEGICSQFPLPV